MYLDLGSERGMFETTPVFLRILGCFRSSFSRKFYIIPDSLAPISQGTKNLSCDSYDIKVFKHKSKLWHILHILNPCDSTFERAFLIGGFNPSEKY